MRKFYVPGLSLQSQSPNKAVVSCRETSVSFNSFTTKNYFMQKIYVTPTFPAKLFGKNFVSKIAGIFLVAFSLLGGMVNGQTTQTFTSSLPNK